MHACNANFHAHFHIFPLTCSASTHLRVSWPIASCAVTAAESSAENGDAAAAPVQPPQLSVEQLIELACQASQPDHVESCTEEQANIDRLLLRHNTRLPLHDPVACILHPGFRRVTDAWIHVYREYILDPTAEPPPLLPHVDERLRS